MKRTILIIFSLFVTIGLQAQIKKSAKNAKTSKVEVKPEQKQMTAQELIAAYKFKSLSDILQKDLAITRKKRQSSEKLQAELSFATMGENMLNSTACITFIDSIVIDKDKFLDAFRLGDEAGKLDFFKNAFNISKGDSALINSTTYTPQLRDKIYYSDVVDSSLNLFSRDRLDDKWSDPNPISGLENFGSNQISPYVLTDGTTMYFAATGDQSLGGYDIYLTRYNTDEGKFLRPENIGMPFNSPDNDYMYAVDEANNLGWFVSDRRQPQGKVCVYVFIPSATRENYAFANEDSLRNFARINSIRDTWPGKMDEVNAALAKLKALFTNNGSVKKTEDFSFIVNDDITYTSLSDFRNAEAKKLAAQWVTSIKLLKEQSTALENDRDTYANASAEKRKALSSKILNEEQQTEKLSQSVSQLEKLIRKAELSK